MDFEKTVQMPQARPQPIARESLIEETKRQDIGIVAAVVFACMFAAAAAWQTGLASVEQTGVSQSEAEENKSLLEARGLPSTFSVRDYGKTDGDQVSINGSPLILLSGHPTPVSVAAGPVVITGSGGTEGCVSVAVTDETTYYDLCLAQGESVKTFVRGAQK